LRRWLQCTLIVVFSHVNSEPDNRTHLSVMTWQGRARIYRFWGVFCKFLWDPLVSNFFPFLFSPNHFVSECRCSSPATAKNGGQIRGRPSQHRGAGALEAAKLRGRRSAQAARPGPDAAPARMVTDCGGARRRSARERPRATGRQRRGAWASQTLSDYDSLDGK
jgi:hypothetical protein